MAFGGTRRALLSVVLAVASASAPLVHAIDASAQPPKKKGAAKQSAAPAANANKTRAAELFKKSADAYLHGDFKGAIALLDEAYALDPQPVLVYNQARAHEGLGNTDEAIALYERYLTEEPSSPDRGAIEQRLATLKRQQEEKKRLEKEKVEIEQKRAQQEQQEKQLAEREQESKSAPASTSEPRKRSVMPYVVAGVGVAGLAAGTVFGVLALDKESTGNSTSSLRDATEAQDTGRTFATISNVGFIVGGVLLVGGAVWWILDGNAAKKTGSRPLLLGGTF